MSSNNLRNQWRIQWLKSINQLTNLELQKKSWLDVMNSNPHWSFVEFICSYFDDLGLSDSGYQHFIDNNWINESEYLLIIDWHKDLDKYESPNKDDNDHQAILSDEEWKRIVKLGFESKAKLVEILQKHEKKYLQ